MNQTMACLAALLLACSSPAVCGCSDGGGDDGPGDALPASFRIEAEVVSVDAFSEATRFDCDPRDAVAGAPDWVATFDITDAAEPTFSAGGHDDAGKCQQSGGADCCRPLMRSGDGLAFDCDGALPPPGGHVRRRFAFTFAADGSGSVSVAAVSDINGATVCTSIAAWTAIVPL